jgi:hypothetical protein
MQSAIIQGLYDINTTEPFNCPGICRWTGSYISLGFKAECRNVTQETLQTATCEGDVDSLQKCKMTTPGGIDLATRSYYTDLATAYSMNTSSLLMDRSTPELPDTFPEITRFAIYRSTPDYNFRMHDINITDCSLSITAYEYTGAKSDGSGFSFTSRRKVDFGVNDPWTLDYEAGRDMLFVSMYTNESKFGDIHIPPLGMNYASLAALENLFKSTTIVSEWVEGNVANTNLGVAAALSGDVDLGDRFDKMATAMTNYLRYGPNTQSAHGETIQSEPFVSIRWGYFVIPIVTEWFAILFAILSIFSNRQSRRVPLWKSSTLAVLACQHEKRLALLQTTGKDIETIRNEAEHAEVRLL